MVAGLLTMILGLLVITPAFVARNSWGDAGGFVAALVVSSAGYWFSLRILEQSSPS
jgi:hypothetical protein